MKYPTTSNFFLLLIFSMMSSFTNAQSVPIFSDMPPIPDIEGFAGMYAGVSRGQVFCMGGAKFEDKRPWEGGKKSWYDDIYRLVDGKRWEKLKQKMPKPMAYGVSVTYQNSIFMIGGNDGTRNYDEVVSFTWENDIVSFKNYPALPITIANMGGTIVGHYIIIAGGNITPSTGAIKKCFALNMENINAGWFEIPAWPGRERLLPITTAYNDAFYLFSGETADIDETGKSSRVILEDAYRLKKNTINQEWEWDKLANLPAGLCAGGNPTPVSANGTMLFWGGVDKKTALHTSPVTHPGFPSAIYYYLPHKNEWQLVGHEEKALTRVTLPIVFWNNQWIYISGEIKAAVRTNTVIAITF